ncbi:glycosyltransferase family 4 protein [Candidatus Borrarchaeum sp.]|uniref:glycosyltransferase family 4 protein n=1 Tax=Candidatus Borrarchaeum sp. TaxID=2846742 RepID=UPI002579EC7E|nr:glycosyltransferase family 4 protein [Candidatus Borrarchaeum sp.]
MKIAYLAERVVRAQETALAIQEHDISCEIIDVKRIIGFSGRWNAPVIGKKYGLVKIYNKIQEYSPDLIMSDTVSLVNIYPLISKITRSIPFCIRLRGNFWDEVKQRRSEQKTFMNFTRSLMINSLGNFCLKMSNIILPVCNYLRKVTLGYIPAPKKNFTVFNGVNNSRFNLTVDGAVFRQKYNLESQKLIVCVLGFDFPEKVRGIAYHLPTIKKMLEKHRDVSFVIVGKGRYRNYFKEIIKRYKLSSRIIMTGFLKGVEYAYAAADIIFYPTFHDSLPTVLLEASACGKPIIASKIGGIPEIILNNETGLLFDPYEKKKLINYFEILLEDESLKKRLGTNARKRIEDYFNWSKIGKRLSAILYSLLDD